MILHLWWCLMLGVWGGLWGCASKRGTQPVSMDSSTAGDGGTSSTNPGELIPDIEEPPLVEGDTLTVQAIEVTPYRWGRYEGLKLRVSVQGQASFVQYTVCSLENPKSCAPGLPGELFGTSGTVAGVPPGPVVVSARGCVRPYHAVDPKATCGPWLRQEAVQVPSPEDIQGVALILKERNEVLTQIRHECRKLYQAWQTYYQMATESLENLGVRRLVKRQLVQGEDASCAHILGPRFEELRAALLHQQQEKKEEEEEGNGLQLQGTADQEGAVVMLSLVSEEELRMQLEAQGRQLTQAQHKLKKTSQKLKTTVAYVGELRKSHTKNVEDAMAEVQAEFDRLAQDEAANLAMMNAHIQTLKTEKDQLTEQLTVINKQNKQAMRQLETVKQDEVAKRASLELERNELLSKTEQLETLLVKKNTQVKLLSHQKNASDLQLESLDKTHAEAFNALTQKNAKLNKQLQTTKHAHDELETQLKKTEDALSDNEKELLQAQQKLSEAQTKWSSLVDASGVSHEKIQELTEKVASKAEYIKNLTGETQILMKTNRELNEERGDWLRTLSEFKLGMGESHEEIRTLKEQIEQVKRISEQEKHALKEKLSNLQDSLDQQQRVDIEDVAKLKEQLSGLEIQRQSLTAKVTAQELRISQQVNLLKKSKKKINTFNEVSEKAKLHQASLTLLREQSDIEGMKKQIQELTDEIAKRKVDAAEQHQKLSETIDTQNAEIEKQKNALQKLGDQGDQLTATQKELQEKNQSLSDKIRNKEFEIAQHTQQLVKKDAHTYDLQVTLQTAQDELTTLLTEKDKIIIKQKKMQQDMLTLHANFAKQNAQIRQLQNQYAEIQSTHKQKLLAKNASIQSLQEAISKQKLEHEQHTLAFTGRIDALEKDASQSASHILKQNADHEATMSELQAKLLSQSQERDTIIKKQQDMQKNMPRLNAIFATQHTEIQKTHGQALLEKNASIQSLEEAIRKQKLEHDDMSAFTQKQLSELSTERQATKALRGQLTTQDLEIKRLRAMPVYGSGKEIPIMVGVVGLVSAITNLATIQVYGLAEETPERALFQTLQGIYLRLTRLRDQLARNDARLGAL